VDEIFQNHQIIACTLSSIYDRRL